MPKQSNRHLLYYCFKSSLLNRLVSLGTHPGLQHKCNCKSFTVIVEHSVAVHWVFPFLDCYGSPRHYRMGVLMVKYESLSKNVPTFQSSPAKCLLHQHGSTEDIMVLKPGLQNCQISWIIQVCLLLSNWNQCKNGTIFHFQNCDWSPHAKHLQTVFTRSDATQW